MNKPRRTRLALAATLAFSVTLITAFARHRFPNQADDASQSHPPPNAKWMNTTLSPDERAAMVLKEMTLDEKMESGTRQWHAGLARQDIPKRVSRKRGRWALCSACRGWAFR